MIVKEKPRVYGAWAGDPKGTPENKQLCVQTVRSSFSFGYHQCCRKRGHGKDGLYCKQHAKKHPA